MTHPLLWGQVLLSQQHRLRALALLDRFLSLGPWAVYKALSVGIFPYVFKLLGSPAAVRGDAQWGRMGSRGAVLTTRVPVAVG